MKTKPTNLAEGTLYCHYYVINCKHILKNSFCCLMNMNKSRHGMYGLRDRPPASRMNDGLMYLVGPT